MTLITYELQAWAFTMGVRLCLNKVPFMNMENYDKDNWILHRKLFHRFVKYFKYFKKATETLPEFQRLLAEEHIAQVQEEEEQRKKTEETASAVIIDLRTSSSDDVSGESEGDSGSDSSGFLEDV